MSWKPGKPLDFPRNRVGRILETRGRKYYVWLGKTEKEEENRLEVSQGGGGKDRDDACTSLNGQKREAPSGRLWKKNRAEEAAKTVDDYSIPAGTIF